MGLHPLGDRVHCKLVANSRAASHSCQSKAFPLYLQFRMIPHSQQLSRAVPDVVPNLPLFADDVGQLRCPTLCFVPIRKQDPFFARALSSTLRPVLYGKPKRGLAEALHVAKVCSSLPKK